MTDTSATVLLQRKLDRTTNEHDLEELASILEYMPLVINYEAAHLRRDLEAKNSIIIT
jgi:hypothetical protein